MKRIKFNDEVVKPYIEEIANLGISRHQINVEQITRIQKLLKIHELNDIEELRAIRNSVVKLLNDEMDKYHTKDYFDAENFDKYDWEMKGCIMVIDSRI